MMKKIQMHPSWRALIHTAQEEEIEGNRAEGECKSISVLPIMQAKHSHAPFLYKKQAKKNHVLSSSHLIGPRTARDPRGVMNGADWF